MIYPLYQIVEENGNIAKRNLLELTCFLTGLIIDMFT
jgi:hypothetical protein